MVALQPRRVRLRDTTGLEYGSGAGRNIPLSKDPAEWVRQGAGRFCRAPIIDEGECGKDISPGPSVTSGEGPNSREEARERTLFSPGPHCPSRDYRQNPPTCNTVWH